MTGRADVIGVAPLVTTLAGLLLACSPGEPSTESPPPGVAIPASEVRVLGTTDAIAGITDVAPAGDAAVWILNEAEPFFVAMTMDGEVTDTWGRQGGGPAELRRPVGLVTDGGTGNVWAYDPARGAVVRVDGSQSDPETIPLTGPRSPGDLPLSFENAGTGAGRPWLRSGDDGFLLARGTGQGALRLWHAVIVELDRDGTTEPVFDVGDRLGDPASKYGDASEFLPFPMWALCHGPSLAIYDPVVNTVRRFSMDGEESGVHALPTERQLELTPDRVFRMVWGMVRESAPGGTTPDSAQLHQQLEQTWEEVTAVASKTFPEYADLRCAPDGSLWMERFDPDLGMMGRSPFWIRVTRAGDVGSLVMPEGFTPVRFGSDRIWGIVTDDLGVEAAAWVPYPGA